MGFVLLPLALLMMGLGLQMQMQHWATSVQGAGSIGGTNSLALVRAQQIEVFGQGCENAALGAPGLVAPSIPVTLSAGVLPPAQAICMTTAGGSGSRNVYAYMSGVPGEAGQIMVDTGSSAVWYRVQSAGQAVNLANAQIVAVPPSIPVGAIVDTITVTP